MSLLSLALSTLNGTQEDITLRSNQQQLNGELLGFGPRSPLSRSRKTSTLDLRVFTQPTRRRFTP